MNLCLETNPDKHSNLKDFICSLKLRCTSEKRLGGEAAGELSSDTLTCIYLLLIFFLRRGTVCKRSARRLILWAGLLFSFLFSLSALETELLYYTPAPNVFALESRRKAFFLNSSQRLPSASDRAALHLARRYLFWVCLCATLGFGGEEHHRIAAEDWKPQTSLAAALQNTKQKISALWNRLAQVSHFFGNWFAASSCIRAPFFFFFFKLYLFILSNTFKKNNCDSSKMLFLKCNNTISLPTHICLEMNVDVGLRDEV